MQNDPRDQLQTYSTKRLIAMLLSHPLWDGTRHVATLASFGREQLIDLVLISHDPNNNWKARTEEEMLY